MGGVNEVLSVYLMAAKLGVPVCPHAGGVGLCEMVQHLQVCDLFRCEIEKRTKIFSIKKKCRLTISITLCLILKIK